MTVQPGPGPRTLHAATVALVSVAAVTIVVLAYIAVYATRTLDDVRTSAATVQREFRQLEVAQHRQAVQLHEMRGIVCDASTGDLVVLKAIRNIAIQQHLNTSGIPARFPPRIERLCDSSPPS